jgi:threonine synthase
MDNPIDGFAALEGIRESRGMDEEVDDMEIIDAQKILLKEEGVDAEPAGAAAQAGLLKMTNIIDEDANIVLLVTGSQHKI